MLNFLPMLGYFRSACSALQEPVMLANSSCWSAWILYFSTYHHYITTLITFQDLHAAKSWCCHILSCCRACSCVCFQTDGLLLLCGIRCALFVCFVPVGEAGPSQNVGSVSGSVRISSSYDTHGIWVSDMANLALNYLRVCALFALLGVEYLSTSLSL